MTARSSPRRLVSALAGSGRRRGRTIFATLVAGLGGDSFRRQGTGGHRARRLGDPRAVPILTGAERRIGCSRRRTGASWFRTIGDEDAADRSGDRRSDLPDLTPDSSRPDHRQQPAARRDRGGARRADLVQRRSRRSARCRAGCAASIPRPTQRRCSKKRSPPNRIPRSARRCSRASPRRGSFAGTKEERLAAIACARRQRTDPQIKNLLDEFRAAPDIDPERAPGRRRGACLDRQPPAAGRPRRQSVSGHQPRQRPAARRDRPRHHLRRDGRHQHGAWRDDHARRLYGLCLPATVSRLPAAGLDRRLSRRRGAGRRFCSPGRSALCSSAA